MSTKNTISNTGVTNIGNNSVMFVRVYNQLVPINKVQFIQVDPNKPHNIVQDIPLSEVINRLMWLDSHNFVKLVDDWLNLLPDETNKEEQ